eukprot:2119334-Rhodomonas_salina.2
MTTDYRYTLRRMQPDTKERRHPRPEWWKHGAGSAYPREVNESILPELEFQEENSYNSSAAIIRDAAHGDNLSGGRE